MKSMEQEKVWEVQENKSWLKSVEENHFQKLKQDMDKYTKHLTEGIKETENKLSIEYDWEFLEEQLIRMQSNKKKYEKNNWKKPIDKELLKESLFRHVLAIMNHEYKDDNRDYGHLSAIAINAMFIFRQLKQEEIYGPNWEQYGDSPSK